MPGPHLIRHPDVSTKDVSDQFALHHEDRGALAYRLIAADKDQPGQLPPYVTRLEDAVLRTVAQTH
jgi:hypothetical protein